MSEFCAWSLDDELEDCVWETQCHQDFQFTDDAGPKANGFRFCTFCGKRIVEVLSSQYRKEFPSD